MRVLTQRGQDGLLGGGVIYQRPEHGKDGSRQRAGKIVPSREHIEQPEGVKDSGVSKG